MTMSCHILLLVNIYVLLMWLNDFNVPFVNVCIHMIENLSIPKQVGRYVLNVSAVLYILNLIKGQPHASLIPK